MERYFIGNNTAHGFVGYYDNELKDKKKVILLKGGPGTGKSTILKQIAKEAENRGYDYELWYCSGDPSSLDGVYVKGLNVAIVDATAPHATGADLPIIKDVIIDLATSLKRDRLLPYEEDIKKLIKYKKHMFIRAYQHLNVALCHYNNQIAIEDNGVDKTKIRLYAIDFVKKIGVANGTEIGADKAPRRIFVTAICPNGANAYYDHLKGKKVVLVQGGEVAMNVFFKTFSELIDGGIYLINPLVVNRLDGIVVGDYAIVKDAGHEKEYETVDLTKCEKHEDEADIIEEKNGVILETALAVEELNKAREYHLDLEKYYVGAMDFDNNNRLFAQIVQEMFGD